MEIKTGEETLNIFFEDWNIDYQEKYIDSIWDFCNKRLFVIVDEMIKELVEEVQAKIEFNLYSEGWDDEGVNQFVDEVLGKTLKKLKGEH